jgi:hypothetical protein
MFFRFREKKNPSHTKNHIPFSIFHIPSASETNVTNVRAPGGRRVQGDELWCNWVCGCLSRLLRLHNRRWQNCLCWFSSLFCALTLVVPLVLVVVVLVCPSVRGQPYWSPRKEARHRVLPPCPSQCFSHSVPVARADSRDY